MTNFRNLAKGYTRLSEICLEAAVLQEELGAIEVTIPTRTVTTRRGPGRPAKTNGSAKTANPIVAKVQGWLTDKGVTTFTPRDILKDKVANRAQLTPALKFMVEHGLAQKAGHGRYSTANVAHA